MIRTPDDKQGFVNPLGNGADFVINICHAIQTSPEGLTEAYLIGEIFMSGDSVCLVLG